MLRNYTARKIVIGAFCALIISAPYGAFAQSKVSFNISPTTIEDKVEPGSTHEFTLRVENRGTEMATLYPVARNITAIGTDHQPIYAKGADANAQELASWITFTETALDLPPGKGGALHFSITFPKDARPGSHLAGMFLTQKPPGDLKEGAAVGLDIGAILHFQMAGDIIENTLMREFLTDKYIYGKPVVKFTVSAENKGNTLSRPQGLIDITDMFGKKVESLPVNESAYVISPENKGTYDVTWKPDGFVFGRFEAVVALAVPLVDGGNQTISSMTQFWVLPMNIIGPVLGGLLTFILVLYVLVRLYVRRQLTSLGVRGNASTRGARGLSSMAAVAIGLLFAIIVGLLILFFYFG